jgi:hypothetical protein
MILILFLVGIAVFGAAAVLIPAPGYMDAEYYFATAGQLARGNGFVEPFLWNFLSAPSTLPAPSHTYWQPLASLVTAAPMVIFGVHFRVAQAASVLLAAVIPLLAARLALSLGVGRRAAWLAGVFGLLPGFFAPYMLTTDTFALFAVIGGLLLWQVGEVFARPTAWRWMMLGGLVALGSLARADGLLLWIPVLYALAAAGGRRLRPIVLLIAGFGALMAPWWLRNLAATGAVLSPGAARALWLLDYDELFSFPATQLTFARWWGSGLSTLLLQRLAAVSSNLQSLIAVNGYVLLLPLMVVGGWIHRRHPSVRAGLLYVVALFFFMSFVFPFPGTRGGMFHSSAALMPLLYALAASGVVSAAARVAPRLRWDPDRTRVMLTTICILLAGALSLWALAGKAGVFGAGASFGRNQAAYAAAGEVLRSQGESASVVAVGDPPGFFLASGWKSVAIPHGSEDVLQQVVSLYGVEWVILEADHPTGLDDLYLSPSARSWLTAPLTFLDPAGRPVYLYRVLSEGGS